MNRHTRLCSLVLCFAFVLAAQRLAAGPVDLGQPLPPEMLPREGDADARVFPPLLDDYLPRDAAGLPEAAEPAPRASDYDMEGDWTRVAFHIILDNNYELGVLRHPLSGPAALRLTSTPTFEVEPAISPDGTRMAFASNADGDFDIYVATYTPATGNVEEKLGPPVKLTQNTTHDYRPVWSPDGKRLAFYGFVGEQAEVYVINADGSALGNVSNHPADDAYPTWSPDGTKIAFTSTRTGGFRIFVTGAAGGAATQLSTQPGSMYPTWSPDGQKIAYSGDYNGDGWLDLMMMDANGQNQQALLAYPGAHLDLEPRSWAPDGRGIAYTQIEYILYSGQWYILYVYLQAYLLGQSGGWVQQMLGSTYSFDPYWASIDHKPPQSAVAALPAESPGLFTVYWNGADQGPAGLESFDVQVQTDGGAWVDFQAGTGMIQSQYQGWGGQRLAFRSRGRDYAGNVEPWPATPDAVTMVEDDPPVSFIEPLPAYTRAGEALTVRWGGYDVGPSGLAHFTVEYRIGNAGPWVGWATETQSTEGWFDPVGLGIKAGDRVSFRVRAMDNARNFEAWGDPDGDTMTTYYARSVTGRVIDNTGNPVGGASATVSPAALAPVSSGRDGRYGAYMATQASVTLGWAKAGYGALPSMTRATAGDHAASPVLPPAGNAVSNGAFEAAAWGAWQPGGSIAPALATGEAAHTGAKAAALGERRPPFGEAVRLSNTPQVSEHNATATPDGVGNVFLVWMSGDFGEPKSLYSATRRTNGTMTPAQLLRDDVWAYDVVAGSDGQVHLAAAAGGLYVWHQSGEGWTPAAQLPGATGATAVRMIAGPLGRLDMLWSKQWQHLFHQRWQGSSWSASYEVTTPATLSVQQTELALTPDGALHVAWYEFASNDYSMRYRRLDDSGAWSAVAILAEGFSDGFGMGTDATGRAHVVWLSKTSGETSLRYRARSGGGWGPEETLWVGDEGSTFITGVKVSPDGVAHTLVTTDEAVDYVRREPDGTALVEPLPANFQNGSALIVDAGGGAHVAFVMPDAMDMYNVFYAARSPEGQWSTPFNLSRRDRYSHSPTLTAGANGYIYPAWLIESEISGDMGHLWDAAFAAPLPATVSGESTLAQVVNTPPAANHPVLSFVYESSGPLGVAIKQAGGAGATLWSAALPASPGGMRHEWIDMAGFGGQEVKVVFQTAQTAGGPASWAVIDDVSLGAAHTDIAVTGESSGPAYYTVVHTLRVSNGSALAAGNVTLTHALPATLAFVSAEPAPASLSPLRWELGTLDPDEEVVIRVTTALKPGAHPPVVTATATLATGDAELELLNNTAEVASVLEWQASIPVALWVDKSWWMGE